MASEPEQREILIVDDTPENIDVLSEVLKPFYKRKAALNGEKALAIASAAKPPDLILLDVMMPGMDGYEVCRRLKADERTRDIPVIFVTAKTEVESETKGFELGAVDYITKPISPPVVIARVKTHLELRLARRAVERQNAAMLKDLAMARRVQLGLIPRESPVATNVDIAYAYEPATLVGGDLLDMVSLGDGRILCFVGDAMGHGVQAALIMTVAKTAFRSAVRIGTKPAGILTRMNEDIAGLFDEHFVTAACCVIEAKTGVVDLALAGHMPPMWYRAVGGNVVQDGLGQFPLGITPDTEYESLGIQLNPGDALVFCTDGIVEAENAAGEAFGVERMDTILTQEATSGAKQIVDALREDLRGHCGGKVMKDDLTLLAVTFGTAGDAGSEVSGSAKEGT